MLATVCSSALLLIAFLGHPHVTDACSCLPLLLLGEDDDLCDAMLAKKLLVRAIFLTKEQVVDDSSFSPPGDANVDPNGDPNVDPSIMYHYTAEMNAIFLTDGRSALTVGKTIQVHARTASANLCGIEFQTGEEWLLELNPHNAGHYTSHLCGMNSIFDNNETLQRMEYNECFESTSTSTLQLKGAPPSLGLPRVLPTIKKEALE
jgi:hypothetical protein